jgi:transcription elongation factor Elf1
MEKIDVRGNETTFRCPVCNGEIIVPSWMAEENGAPICHCETNIPKVIAILKKFNGDSK